MRPSFEAGSAWPWLIAAASVVVVLVMTTQEPSPPAAQATPVIESSDEWWKISDNDGPEGGTFRTTGLNADLSYTVPDNWRRFESPEQVMLAAFQPEGSGDAWGFISFVTHHDSSFERVSVGLSSQEDIELTEPTDVVIGGARARTLEMRSAVDQTTLLNPLYPLHPSHPEGVRHSGPTLSAGQAIPIHLVALPGRRVVVIYVVPTRTGDAFTNVAQNVIDTIHWKDLP